MTESSPFTSPENTTAMARARKILTASSNPVTLIDRALLEELVSGYEEMANELMKRAVIGDSERDHELGTLAAMQVCEKRYGRCLLKPSPSCRCWTCDVAGRTRMILCPTCGNKRCPHATHHDNACTNSNATGQPGSRYA